MIYERDIKKHYFTSALMFILLGLWLWFASNFGGLQPLQLFLFLPLGVLFIAKTPEKIKRLTLQERKSVFAKYQYPVWVWALTVFPGLVAGLLAYRAGIGINAIMAGFGAFLFAQGLATLAYLLFFMPKGDLPDIDPV